MASLEKEKDDTLLIVVITTGVVLFLVVVVLCYVFAKKITIQVQVCSSWSFLLIKCKVGMCFNRTRVYGEYLAIEPFFKIFVTDNFVQAEF